MNSRLGIGIVQFSAHDLSQEYAMVTGIDVTDRLALQMAHCRF